MEKEEAEDIVPSETSCSLVHSPDLSQFSDSEPTDGRGGWVPRRKNPAIQWHEYTVMNHQVLP